MDAQDDMYGVIRKEKRGTNKPNQVEYLLVFVCLPTTSLRSPVSGLRPPTPIPVHSSACLSIPCLSVLPIRTCHITRTCLRSFGCMYGYSYLWYLPNTQGIRRALDLTCRGTSIYMYVGTGGSCNLWGIVKSMYLT